jgi:hypothetical protein
VLGSFLSAAEISSLSFIDQLRLTLVVTSYIKQTSNNMGATNNHFPDDQ